MTCAKQTVTATVVTPDGQRFVGTNACDTPQTTCPRSDMPTGEGYELCRNVCHQPSHAEIAALRAAGEHARGATMHIEGHNYACASCSAAMEEAGIINVIFVA